MVIVLEAPASNFFANFPKKLGQKFAYLIIISYL